MLVNIHFSKYHIWNPSLQSTREFKAPKPCEVLQRFFANLNGSMKLLRSERPGISFFAKVVQLLALKCGTGLMFPEKKVVFIAQSGLKHCRWRVETNKKRSGSRFRGRGRDVAKKQLTMNQTTGKAIIQLILHYVLFI